MHPESTTGVRGGTTRYSATSTETEQSTSSARFGTPIGTRARKTTTWISGKTKPDADRLHGDNDSVKHSLSNVLPSKLAYYSYYNDSNNDGFALFQLAERNTNIYSGVPTYRNHVTIFTEVYEWSAYIGRTFSYTNRRFNPENATFLPKGERYEEENLLMTYRYEDLDSALPFLKSTDTSVKNPPSYEFYSASTD